jgi:hypothetical protein
VPTMQALDPALTPAQVVAEFGDAERSVVAACMDLYQGQWDDMAEDIRRRQAGRPYLFRLAIEPGQALAWVEQFKAYEVARGARLGDALPSEDAR